MAIIIAIYKYVKKDLLSLNTQHSPKIVFFRKKQKAPQSFG
jgi:hypothetical protein